MVKSSGAPGASSKAPKEHNGVPPSRLPKTLDLQIEAARVGSLKAYERNARTHSKKQIAQIAASIREFGFLDPILIEADGAVVAGHARLLAAKQLGLKEVPVIRVDHLSPHEVRLYRLAANKLAEAAKWDKDLLALELRELDDLRLNTPLEITGFETGELDLLLDHKPVAKPDKADRIPDLLDIAVTQIGDVWILGEHRLICGDSCDPASYDALMPGEKARMVFADPPYNCPIDGFVGGLGKTKHREFVMGSGEMSDDEFQSFLEGYMSSVIAVSVDGAIHYHCMDWRKLSVLLNVGQSLYPAQKNLITWVKSNGGMGTFYRSRHEQIAVFKVGSAPHINNFGLGDTGRYRTNVWEYAGVNAFGRGRDEALAMHPTVKPVAMVADAIKDVSTRGEIVLDPFVGSGTTVIAAEKTGRRARALDLDPRYCDVTCRRWEAFTGKPALLEATGATFAEAAAARVGEAGDA